MIRCLLFLICLPVIIDAQVSKRIVELKNGRPFLLHPVKAGESVHSLSLDYYVQSRLLSSVNQIGLHTTLTPGQSLRIPLVETNFILKSDIHLGNTTLQPVYYTNTKEEKVSLLCRKFGISDTAFSKWNALDVDHVSYIMPNQTLIVGWLKYGAGSGSELMSKTSPAKVQANRTISKTSSQSTTNAAPSPIENEEAILRRQASAKPSKIFIEGKGHKREHRLGILARRLRPASNPEGENVASENMIHSDASNTLKNPPSKKNQSSPAIIQHSDARTNAINASKANAYANQMAVTMRNKKTDANAASTPIKTIPASPGSIHEKKQVSKTDSSLSKVNLSIQETLPEDKAVHNVIKPLSLTKSKSGKCAFFFNGTSNGQFQVFTNLAGIGSIIKVTNIANNQSVLAEVIGTITASDTQKGVLIKLSDNAKIPLGQLSAVFQAKVNFE